jgi:hypothetical protein
MAQPVLRNLRGHFRDLVSESANCLEQFVMDIDTGLPGSSHRCGQPDAHKKSREGL